MTEKELYTLCCENAKDDPDLCTELESIKDDDDAIVDQVLPRPSNSAQAGSCGVIGAGTDRMNIYTVRRATQGFADYLNQELHKTPVLLFLTTAVSRAMFSQRLLPRFFAANGIKVHI